MGFLYFLTLTYETISKTCFNFKVDAFYGLQLPEKDKKYSIIVRWADFSV